MESDHTASDDDKDGPGLEEESTLESDEETELVCADCGALYEYFRIKKLPEEVSVISNGT
jgi:hypothetical protein